MSKITFLAGHPVPYSVTVQRNGKSVGARPHIEAFRAYMRECATDRETIITRIDGAYIFYDHMPEGFERPRFSVAAIDVGFDVRVQNMLIEFPHDGPVVLEYSTDTRGTEKPSEKVVRLCDSRAEALRVLKRHGYRVHNK
ncbi:MAG: hypothetical protein ACREU9_00170 [Gammaproteobacteria bacterium]